MNPKSHPLTIEIKGGHVATYKDPATGIPYDYGVYSYLDYGPSKDFFARFNVRTSPPTQISVNSTYVDFTSGKIVSDYVPPTAGARTAALTKYLELCELYEKILLPGFWDFPSSNQIPEDLLLDFGEFAKKHGIEAAVPQIVSVSGLGVGTPITSTTLYVMQAFGAPMARAILQGQSFVPASRNNSELYSHITQLLGRDVLYSSQVVEAERSVDGISVVISSTDRKLTFIQAKRLLISFEPTLENLKPFGLDVSESSVFSKWEYSNTYASIVSHPSLPQNGSLVNTPIAAAPSNYLTMPQLPYLDKFNYIGPPGFRALMGVNRTFNSFEAKSVVEHALETLIEAQTVPRPLENVSLKWVSFSDHGPMHLRVGKEELRKGFIQNLYELQGRNGTWYTGAAWSAQFTGVVWAFTETVLGKLLEGL